MTRRNEATRPRGLCERCEQLRACTQYHGICNRRIWLCDKCRKNLNDPDLVKVKP